MPVSRRALLKVLAKNADGFPAELTVIDEHGVESKAPATLPADLLVAAAADELRSPDDVRDLMLRRPGKEELQLIGRYVANLLLRDAIGALWAAQPAGATIDLRFDVAAAPEVSALPLEAIYEVGSGFIAPTAEAGFWRSTKPHAPPHPSERLPLRVLIVIGEREPARGGTIDYATEVTALRKLFRSEPHRVDWEVLERPLASDLDDFCVKFRPHVFHFIGHGKLIARAPVLELWDPEQQTMTALGVDELRTILQRQNWQIPVALFNACRSGLAPGSTAQEIAAADGSRRAVFDLGRVFIELLGGCGAVTMQGDVKGDAAALFGRKFYEDLVGGSRIDVAVANARRFLKQQMPAEPDWVYPVLQLGCDPAAATPAGFGAANLAVEQLKKEFVDLAAFVDRTEERRALWASVVYEQWKGKESFAVVHGPPQIGKTAVVRWLMRNQSLRGNAVRLIDLGDGRTHTAVSIVRAIRDDCHHVWGYHNAFPAAECTALDAALKAIEDGKPLVEKSVPDLLAKLVAALAEIGKQQPLLIVLDHFSRGEVAGGKQRGLFSDDDARELIDGLFVPIAANTAPGVKMIVIALADEVKPGAALAGLKPLGLERPVGLLGKADFKRLALESISDFDDLDEVTIPLANRFENQVPGSWAPALLVYFRELVAKIAAKVPGAGP